MWYTLEGEIKVQEAGKVRITDNLLPCLLIGRPLLHDVIKVGLGTFSCLQGQ